jgi:uncharacterized protein HemX
MAKYDYIFNNMENQTPNQQEKTNKNNLVLPTVILIACLILGGSYYVAQVSKQKSLERQQALKIEEEKRIEAKNETSRKECSDFMNKYHDDLWEKRKEKGIQSISAQEKKDELVILDGLYEQCLKEKGITS